MMREQPEEDDHRLSERICCSNSRAEGGIVDGTLRSSHPVNHASSAGINRVSMAHPHALIESEPIKRCHSGKIGRGLSEEAT